jgi:hypothetical protein
MLVSLAWGCSLARRPGRKRKSGKRHPSGRLAEVRPDLQTRTSRQPHRRKVPDGDRLDQRAESALGRLNLRKDREGNPLITNEQRVAGDLYARAVGAYRSVIEAPSGTAGSGRGSSCVEYWKAGACREDPDNCSCLRAKARYDRAYEAVLDAGQRAAKTVARVAVQGEEPQREDLVYLVLGLNVLARHFGLTAARKREHC